MSHIHLSIWLYTSFLEILKYGFDKTMSCKEYISIRHKEPIVGVSKRLLWLCRDFFDLKISESCVQYVFCSFYAEDRTAKEEQKWESKAANQQPFKVHGVQNQISSLAKKGNLLFRGSMQRIAICPRDSFDSLECNCIHYIHYSFLKSPFLKQMLLTTSFIIPS